MEELQKEGNIMKMGHGDFLTKHSFVHDLGPLTCPAQRLGGDASTGSRQLGSWKLYPRSSSPAAQIPLETHDTLQSS